MNASEWVDSSAPNPTCGSAGSQAADDRSRAVLSPSPSQFTTRDIVDQLAAEYNRVVEGFSRAVQNYYRLLPTISGGVFIMYAAGLQGGNSAKPVLALVPFLLLAIFLYESQVRTTIVGEAAYLRLLETRINYLMRWPVLLHESRLTLGRRMYYSASVTSALKYCAFIPFFVVGFLLAMNAIDHTRSYLRAMSTVDVLGLRLSPDLVWRGYCMVLLVVALLSAVSWGWHFVFIVKTYPRWLDEETARIAKEGRTSCEGQTPLL
jgi:hypothetical protein